MITKNPICRAIVTPGTWKQSTERFIEECIGYDEDVIYDALRNVNFSILYDLAAKYNTHNLRVFAKELAQERLDC